MLFCLIIFLLTLIGENQVVVTGARAGLMLWFHDVLPLLLPFMLLSNLFVLKIRTKQAPLKCGPVLFPARLLCGYPLGAQMASDFTKEGHIKPSTATILLPLCNNISPMFLSGYIGHTVLQDRFPFWFLLVILYVPYVLVTSIVFLVFHVIKKHKYASAFSKLHPASKEAAITSHLSPPSVHTYKYPQKGVSQQAISMQTNDLLLLIRHSDHLCRSVHHDLFHPVCTCLRHPGPARISTILCGILRDHSGKHRACRKCISITCTKTALILRVPRLAASLSPNYLGLKKSGLS